MCGLFLSVAPSNAADIRIVPTATPLQLILIEGELVQGDADRFLEAIRFVELGAVLLESPGGSLIEGLRIGRVIRELGFTTGVAPDTACASACALAWLAGTTRFMDPTALVGFHAAYEENEGRLSESGVGNALVGAYLNELGLGFDAIVFVASAAPHEMNWLNAAKAQQAGIEVVLLTENETETSVSPDIVLKLPKGFRWIVLESRRSLERLEMAHVADQIVRTENGYFASVLGPYEQSIAERLKLVLPFVPDDAYLSSGNGFLFSLQR